MEFLKKVNALVLGLAVLLVVSCGKNDPEPVDPADNTNSRFSLISYSFFEGQDFVAEYMYNPKKQIARIDYRAGNAVLYYETIDYNANGQAIRKDIHAQFDHYLTYEYYPDGSLSKIRNFLSTSATQPASLTDIREFTYYNDKRLKQEKTFFGQDLTAPVSFTELTYPTDSTAVLKTHDPNTGDPALNYLLHTREVKFDKQNNPAQLLGVIDNTGDFNLGFKHNITYSKQTFANNTVGTIYTRRYTYNAEGYPVSVTHQGPNATTTETFVYSWL